MLNESVMHARKTHIRDRRPSVSETAQAPTSPPPPHLIHKDLRERDVEDVAEDAEDDDAEEDHDLVLVVLPQDVAHGLPRGQDPQEGVVRTVWLLQLRVKVRLRAALANGQSARLAIQKKLERQFDLPRTLCRGRVAGRPTERKKKKNKNQNQNQKKKKKKKKKGGHSR